MPQHNLFDDPYNKRCFVLFKQNFLYFSLCPLPLVLSLDSTQNHLSPFSLRCLLVVFMHGQGPSKHSYLCAEHYQLSEALFVWMVLHSFNCLCGPPLDSLQKVHFPLQSSTHQVWPHLCGQRRVVNTFNLLAALLLTQPKMHLAIFTAKAYCWWTFCSPGHPSPSLPAFLPPPEGWSLRLFLPCWVSWGSSLPAPPACQGASGWQHTQVVYQPSLLFCTISKPAGGALCPGVHVLYKDAKENQHLYCPLEPSTGDWPPAGSHTAGHKPPGWPFSQFSISFSIKSWCEKVSKFFLFISFLSGLAEEPLRHNH